MSHDLQKYSPANPQFVIEEEQKSACRSILEIKPLESGYGHTVGNSLRRVLLSSLPGAAITRVRIEGVDHQFSTMEGVREDVIEILLNLKQVRVKADNDESGILRLNVTGPMEVTAANFDCEAGFTIVNPDQVIAKLAKGVKLELEARVESGVGYQVGDESADKQIGEIVLDALFSPVVKVSYQVEDTRVGRRTDLDKIILDLTTDGTISPREAVDQAAQILAKQFAQLYAPVVEEAPAPAPTLSPEEVETLRLTVEELDLPTRIANALRRGGYKNVGDLAQANRSAIAKVKNIGEKSVSIVEEALAKKGVNLKD